VEIPWGREEESVVGGEKDWRRGGGRDI